MTTKKLIPIYRLKTDPEPFQKMKTWDKTAEARINDRNYQKGGVLVLQEYDRSTQTYSGDEITRTISDVTYLSAYGAPDHVLLSFEIPQASEAKYFQKELKEIEGKLIAAIEVLERAYKQEKVGGAT